MAAIIDTFGRAIEESMPEQPTLVGVYPTRDWSSLISSTLDVETVITYLNSAERGNIRYQMEMFDRMIERDPHLQSVLQTRRLALTQAEWRVVPGDETDSRAIDAAEFVADQVTQLEEFDDDIHALLDAVPKGLAVMEIVYNKDWTIDRLVEIPQKLFDWTSDDLRVFATGYIAEPLTPNKFIVHSPRIKAGSPLRRGLMRTLSVYWCISHFAMEDWAGFAEVFGQPIRLGKYGPGASENDKDVLWEALKAIGSDACGIVPESMQIEFPEPASRKSGGTNVPMQEIIDHIERKMSISVLGQNLTTQSESGSGTLAGNAAERVQKGITRADARQVGTTIRRDLFRPLVGFNFGFETPLPHLRWNLDDPIDQETRAKVFQIATDMGQPVSKAQVREELELREPDDADDVLVRPEPMPALFETQLAATKKNTLPVGSAMRANQMLAANAADQQRDAMNQVLGVIGKMAEAVDTPEQMLTRIKLAAPDLEEVLKAAGLDLEEFEDLAARALVTADLNGRLAVRAEREV